MKHDRVKIIEEQEFIDVCLGVGWSISNLIPFIYPNNLSDGTQALSYFMSRGWMPRRLLSKISDITGINASRFMVVPVKKEVCDMKKIDVVVTSLCSIDKTVVGGIMLSGGPVRVFAENAREGSISFVDEPSSDWGIGDRIQVTIERVR